MLEDLARESVDQVLVLGDTVLKLGDSARVMAMLAEIPHRRVYGNMEWAILRYGSPAFAAQWPDDATPELSSWAADVELVLAEVGREVFAHQPATIEVETPIGRLVACHGTPASCLGELHPPSAPGHDRSPWVHDDARFAAALGLTPPAAPPNGAAVGERPDRADPATLPGVPAVVVAGHTHVPFVRRSGTTDVVNPGAVGWSRAIVADRYKARYAILTVTAGRRPRVEWRALAYDNAGALASLRRKQAVTEARIVDPTRRDRSARWHDMLASMLGPSLDRR